LKADYKLKDWLKAGANMSYTHYASNSLGEDGNSGSSANIFAFATSVAPIYPLYVRDGAGNKLQDANGYTMYDFGDGMNAGLGRPVHPGSNPYLSNVLDKNFGEGNAMNAIGFFDLNLTKKLVFSWNSSVTVDETRSNSFTNPYYGQYADANGMSDMYHTRSLASNHQQLLNYTTEFGLNSLNIMAGHEYYRRQYYYTYASRSNFFDPNNTELSGAIIEKGANSYTTDYNTEGFFGRVQYDYDDKYFFSGSFRRDASSRFHPEHRWGNFWSAGGAWVINRENWFNSTKFDLLKLKASYGQQGNDNIGNYRYTSTYDIVNSNGSPAAVPSTLGSKGITWETNGNLNAGVDFEMFKGRFNGTVEYFYRKTTDMLFSFPLPPSFGYTSYYANIGDMANNGVEAEFKVTPIRTKDFEWNINLNLTHYKNKVTYLPEERKTMECSGVKGFSSGNMFYGEGISLYTFRMKQYAGVDQETGEALYYMDVTDSEGNVTGRTTTAAYNSATYYLCGTSLPDVYGGFGTSLSYKGFDLSVDFGYQIGGQVYDGDYAGYMSSPTSSSKGQNFHKDLLNAWTPENKNTNIPRFQTEDIYTTASSDRFLTDASYLSLQNVNLGYTLPVNLTRKAQIESARFYVTADNLFVWSQRKGLDPRQSITGSATNSYYAPIRTISGGVTLTF
jgi:TonB-linked SusC/RagA family outer membrane protein